MSMIFDETFKVYRQREMIRVVAPDGARTSIRIRATGETKAACKEEFERKCHEARTNAAAPPAAAPPKVSTPVSEYVATWLRDYPASKGNRENTRIEKEYHCRIHLLPFFERLAAERGGTAYTLAEVTAKVLDRFGAELANATCISRAKDPKRRTVRPLSLKTRANVMQTIGKILATAKRHGEVDSVPEVERIRVPKSKFDFFTFAEADRLLGAIKDADDRALIMAGLRSGARAGELLGLRWSDVDLVARKVRIDHQLARKGSARVPVKAGERSVPMPAGLVATLKEAKHLRSAATGGWVFCDPDGRPFSRGHLRKTLAKWCRRAGLRELHPHGLRHSFASHAVMLGVPIAQVKEWLGHGTITMTMRYAHLAPGSGDDLIERLEAPANTNAPTTERTRAAS